MEGDGELEGNGGLEGRKEQVKVGHSRPWHLARIHSCVHVCAPGGSIKIVYYSLLNVDKNYLALYPVFERLAHIECSARACYAT